MVFTTERNGSKMIKLNLLNVSGGVLGGVAVYLFGEMDAVFAALLVAVVIDFTAGVIKGIHNHCLSSKLCMQGICKKTVMFAVVAAAHITESATGNIIPLRGIVIGFFFINEIISILENAAEMGIGIPKQFTKYLMVMKRKHEDE